ncbi:unnamed protein product [Soboliphyme baturini]|uniref:Uncharacterized protein n=1 Tax=Soboliphyme baturini TaxID=241478 RepID=A0A183ICY4_9BILA|nr:unnamed protein product [Soboliphyme baturini]
MNLRKAPNRRVRTNFRKRFPSTLDEPLSPGPACNNEATARVRLWSVRVTFGHRNVTGFSRADLPSNRCDSTRCFPTPCPVHSCTSTLPDNAPQQMRPAEANRIEAPPTNHNDRRQTFLWLPVVVGLAAKPSDRRHEWESRSVGHNVG